MNHETSTPPFQTRASRQHLVVLTMLHFVVDFCGGLLIPLPEPTLTGHLNTDLARIGLLIGGSALVVNIVQPLVGWLLPRRGAPILLLLAPPAAALIACIGLSANFWIVAAMLLCASVGIGIVHPEAALAAHSVSGSRKGFGMSLFMSGGYFGFSFGSIVSGVWVEHHHPGLSGFWILMLPALAVSLAVYLTGLHRMEGHVTPEIEKRDDGALPFRSILALSVGIAMTMCLLVRFLPILMVRRFPELPAQGWAGATVFATGLTGALGSYLWGHLSERWTRGRIILLAQCLGAPFLYLLLHVSSLHMAPVWAAGLGFTIGGVFPLCVVLARHAYGPALRLRIGLAIGGAWGTGELAFILGSRYIAAQPDPGADPVMNVLNLCWLLLIVVSLCAVRIGRMERRL